MSEEPRLFKSKLEFALNRFNEVNRFHLENGAKLRKSPNLAKIIIGYVGPAAHMLMAYTFAPLAILVAMEDAEYSNERRGYISGSHKEWLDRLDKKSMDRD